MKMILLHKICIFILYYIFMLIFSKDLPTFIKNYLVADTIQILQQ